MTRPARWLTIGAVIAAAVIGGLTCIGAVVDPLPAAQRPASWAQPVDGGPGLLNFHRVDDVLYRSQQPTAAGMAAAHQRGITSVINLRAHHGDRAEIGQLPLARVEIPIDTWALRDEHVIAFLKAVRDPAYQPALVHCAHGADRTGTMCAMYRICVQGWDREEAILEMTRGGFGYHAVWTNLLEYIRGADIDALRRAAGIPAPSRAAVDPDSPQLRDARALVTRLRADLEALAPRRFVGPVAVVFQTEADFRAYVTKDLDTEFPPEREAAQKAWMVGLGLLAPDGRLREALVNTVLSQALAYYDSGQDTFFVVKQGLPESLRDPMYLHELQHALQDQVLGLDRILALARSAGDNQDRAQALRFLWEGEARFLETVYTLQLARRGNILQGAPDTANRVFRRAMNRRFEDIVALTEQAVPFLGDDGPAMLAGLKAAPPFVVRQLAEPYEHGAWAMYRAYRAGGWEAVDALWATPPTSTEQMLHPETKLFGSAREEPVVVALPDLTPFLGPDAVPLSEETMGEHGILILLGEQLPELRRGRATLAAAGWGGDRLRGYRVAGAARPLVVWLSEWDTAEDATQFAQAYHFAAQGRNLARGWPAAAIQPRERVVAVVEGAEPELADRLAQALLAAAPAAAPAGD